MAEETTDTTKVTEDDASRTTEKTHTETGTPAVEKTETVVEKK